VLGSYPDLAPLGVPGGRMDCVEDGDLALISAPIDGLGVNYYMPTRLSALPGEPLPFQLEPVPGYPVTAFGWPVVPAAFTELLDSLRHRYGDALPPVYITENGCSQPDVPDANGFVDDQDRIAYLDSHIRVVHAAMADGVDVRGYFQWTLTDNFEWSEGYHQRFGLVYTDFDTQRRTPKASFRWYRGLIAGQAKATQT
jgi:beta-glucosidase